MDAVKPEIIKNIDELKRIIRYDEYKGKRGVFITLIHKFRPEELEELSSKLIILPFQVRITYLPEKT